MTEGKLSEIGLEGTKLQFAIGKDYDNTDLASLMDASGIFHGP